MDESILGCFLPFLVLSQELLRQRLLPRIQKLRLSFVRAGCEFGGTRLVGRSLVFFIRVLVLAGTGHGELLNPHLLLLHLRLRVLGDWLSLLPPNHWQHGRLILNDFCLVGVEGLTHFWLPFEVAFLILLQPTTFLLV